MEYYESNNGGIYAKKVNKPGIPPSYIPICTTCHGREECKEEHKERRLTCPEILWSKMNPPSVLQDAICIHI